MAKHCWRPTADIDREMAEILVSLDRYHQVEPIEVDGVLAKAVRAIGPDWRQTAPNAPTRIRRAELPARVSARTGLS
jgi:hypothetical protein